MSRPEAPFPPDEGNEFGNPLIRRAVELLSHEFGAPSKTTKKVVAWDMGPSFGVVIERTLKGQQANIWMPYPPDKQAVPAIALEYPGEAGRHSNTYASPGLKKGLPALKLLVTSEAELIDTVAYIRAFRDALPLPEIRSQSAERYVSLQMGAPGVPADKMRPVRREAIPRAVQREVWQRDGGRCVECGTREKLCFDHIIPFSRGGSNTIRNLQLLCERCNLSKGNRI